MSDDEVPAVQLPGAGVAGGSGGTTAGVPDWGRAMEASFNLKLNEIMVEFKKGFQAMNARISQLHPGVVPEGEVPVVTDTNQEPKFDPSDPRTEHAEMLNGVNGQIEQHGQRTGVNHDNRNPNAGIVINDNPNNVNDSIPRVPEIPPVLPVNMEEEGTFVVRRSVMADSVLVVDNWMSKKLKDYSSGIISDNIMMIPKHDNIRTSGDIRALNIINCFEADINDDDKEWLQTLPIIMSRRSIFLPDSPTEKKMETASKMDNLFINQIPEFMKSDKFQFNTYIEKFWDVMSRHMIENEHFAKNQLFNQINQTYPEVCSEEMRPSDPIMKKISLKAYIIKLKLKFQPSNQKEIAISYFERYVQNKGRTIDAYFDEKLRLYHVAYGRHPTELNNLEFFKRLHQGMESIRLADKLTDYKRCFLDMKKPDIFGYKNQMLQAAQQLIDGYHAGIYRSEDIKGCKSMSYSGMKKSGTHNSKDYRKGGAQNPITVAQVNQNEEDSDISEIYVSDESEDLGYSAQDDTDEERIMIMNDRKANENIKCFYCAKLGHTIRQCWDKQQNKPPHPMGVVAQKQKDTKNGNERRFVKKPENKPKKKVQKGKRPPIHNIGKEESDSEFEMSEETIAYLDQMNDLKYLPSPLDYEVFY